jgi:carbonic anhydrase/acetyltransferase-like protein (isoleucine patch superfamily)
MQSPAYWPEPDVSKAAFIAPNAIVIGLVTIGTGASIWYGAVVRADVERIIIGDRSNVQDGAILHGDPGKVTVLEADVTIGHRAVIHGAYIESGCLIGIGATILDGVVIGSGSIVGAGAVVTKSVPPRSLVVGIPGKVVRQLSEAEAADLIIHAHHYEKLAQVHNGTGKDLGFKKI